MRIINNRILEDLSSLINMSLEIRSGYKNAAENVNDKNLKEIFIVYLEKITEDINELKKLEKDLSNDKKTINHQLKEFSFQLLGTDEISVLKKCENLEERSIREYEILLKENYPAYVKEIFLKQYNGMKETQLHMRSLENQY